MAAGATWAAEGFFATAPSIVEGRAGAAEGPSPEVVLAAGAAWGAEGFFAAAPSIAEGPSPEVDLAAGATSAAAGVGVCTAAPVEAFAEAAETRAASAATEGPSIAAAGE